MAVLFACLLAFDMQIIEIKIKQTIKGDVCIRQIIYNSDAATKKKKEKKAEY